MGLTKNVRREVTAAPLQTRVTGSVRTASQDDGPPIGGDARPDLSAAAGS